MYSLCIWNWIIISEFLSFSSFSPSHHHASFLSDHLTKNFVFLSPLFAVDLWVTRYSRWNDVCRLSVAIVSCFFFRHYFLRELNLRISFLVSSVVIRRKTEWHIEYFVKLLDGTTNVKRERQCQKDNDYPNHIQVEWRITIMINDESRNDDDDDDDDDADNENYFVCRTEGAHLLHLQRTNERKKKHNRTKTWKAYTINGLRSHPNEWHALHCENWHSTLDSLSTHRAKNSEE